MKKMLFVFLLIFIAACSQQVESNLNFASASSGSTDTGDVEIQLTPYFDGRVLNVDMAVNTHSVDLSQFDLKEKITLEAEGKILKPSSAPVLSGHHANGVLVFKTGSLESFIIKINGIPKLNERIYEWR